MSTNQVIWHLNIPKILHVYWGGGVLPYIRYKTITSFIKHNPDWEVRFWYPVNSYVGDVTWKTKELDYEVNCKNFLHKALDLPITRCSFDFNKMIGRNDIAENFKSDFIRAYLLSTIGGVWSDMDVIYFRPMYRLKVNITENNNKKTFVCMNKLNHHSNGFLMASTGNAFFHQTLILARDNFDPAQYQSIGPSLYNRFFPTLRQVNKYSPAVNLSMDTVYSHGAVELLETKVNFTEESIGCHWYAGHSVWEKFFRDTDGGLRNVPDCVIGKLLKDETK